MGALAGPGIGLAFFIIQTLWSNARQARTAELRESGLQAHEFPVPDAYWDDPAHTWHSLDEGLLGYACKFWEWIDYKYGAEYYGTGPDAYKRHKHFDWGDASIIMAPHQSSGLLRTLLQCRNHHVRRLDTNRTCLELGRHLAERPNVHHG